ncbi:hypothetical protein LY78DRAFT_741693 [Colletotrichum sublineola]|nr:hypothetical protein LY78DRAFT_741693 [Colletotrichum sublineola]
MATARDDKAEEVRLRAKDTGNGTGHSLTGSDSDFDIVRRLEQGRGLTVLEKKRKSQQLPDLGPSGGNPLECLFNTPKLELAELVLGDHTAKAGIVSPEEAMERLNQLQPAYVRDDSRAKTLASFRPRMCSFVI